MEFGLFDHLDRRDQPLPQFYEERLKFIAAGEQAGFRAYHLAEHHGTPLGMAPSPSVFLSAVAQRTRTMRFGPMVYILPLYTPLRLVEEICMLDQLSNGRLDVGVGRGVSPVETGFYGLDQDQSFSIYAEVLDVLRQGLTQDRLTHHGDYFHYDSVPMTIMPAQARIPFWCAPASPESQVFAAQHGMHIMALGSTDRIKGIADNYRKAWVEQADHPRRAAKGSEEPLIGAYRLVFVAETDSKAESIARGAYKSWFDKLALLWIKHNVDTYILTLERYEAARDMGMLIVGSPARVEAELAAQLETADFNYPVLQFAFGSLGHAVEMNSLALFAEEVMPAFANV
jgi:alkanesulfonate monooxygenase SsuD/methylene tetrahydromethanopterin reductase-like flavin-dependent oxidoreductase (luciferase family)